MQLSYSLDRLYDVTIRFQQWDFFYIISIGLCQQIINFFWAVFSLKVTLKYFVCNEFYFHLITITKNGFQVFKNGIKSLNKKMYFIV